MEKWQKDLLSEFVEVKFPEIVEWLIGEWRGDIKEIPRLFKELYMSAPLDEWLFEEIDKAEMDANYDGGGD